MLKYDDDTYANAEDVKRVSPLMDGLERVDKVMAVLGDSFSRLEGRLHPVLKGSVPRLRGEDVPADLAATGNTTSLVMEQLEAIITRLQNFNGNLREITERVEV